jgi:catechol 2,3-dioxygenase-like lactoylglutathione lyase family enzyme
MIDHTAVNVSDLEASKRSYDQALKPLGYSLVFEAGEFLGYVRAPFTMNRCAAGPRWAARGGVLGRPCIARIQGLPASLPRTRPSHPCDEDPL